jgi:hypothetical protein
MKKRSDSENIPLHFKMPVNRTHEQFSATDKYFCEYSDVKTNASPFTAYWLHDEPPV